MTPEESSEPFEVAAGRALQAWLGDRPFLAVLTLDDTLALRRAIAAAIRSAVEGAKDEILDGLDEKWKADLRNAVEHEREECAKVAEKHPPFEEGADGGMYHNKGTQVAAAIRSRREP